MRYLGIAFMLAAALMVGVVAPAAAQNADASPTPMEPLELTPCTVEPITFDEMTSTLATPAAEEAAAEPEASPAAGLPEGEPADDETAEAVIASVEQLSSCLNEGKLLSTLALYSDGFLQSAFSGAVITEEDFNEQVAVETPRTAEEQIEIYSFGEVVILEDGRAAVVAVGDDLQSDNPATATLFIMIDDEGVWKVDETVNNVETES